MIENKFVKIPVLSYFTTMCPSVSTSASDLSSEFKTFTEKTIYR